MSKATDEIKSLQRSLSRLSALRGALVIHAAEEPVLAWPTAVVDPRPLVAHVARGELPGAASLQVALRSRRPPQPLTAAYLARAQRELSLLRREPVRLARVAEAPRRFRGIRGLGPEFLDQAAADLAGLAAARAEAPTSPRAVADALIRHLHGEDAARALAALVERTAAARSRAARASRLVELARIVAGEPAARAAEGPLAAVLEDAAARLRAGGRAGGRARRRRLRRVVAAVLAWPEGHDSIDLAESTWPDDPRAPWPAQLRQVAAALARAPATSPAEERAGLEALLLPYALMFRVEPGAPGSLGPAECERLRAGLGDVVADMAGLDLPFGHVLWLLSAVDGRAPRAALARLLAAGLERGLVEAVRGAGHLDELPVFADDPAAARAYCEWVARLVPHFRAQGREVRFPARSLADLLRRRRPELHLLARCVALHEGPEPDAALRELGRLDATLALFRQAPRRAAALLSALQSPPAGLGRARFSDFAAWLDDHVLLDRYCHLAALAGEAAELSHTLRRDFAAGDRLRGQIAYLQALPAPTPEQTARLAGLRAAAERAPDPGWTRRRLAERCEELLARAYQRQLDAIFCEIVRERFGVQPPAALTPGWRDAIRFCLLHAERNQDLLAALIRFAAAHPGRPIAAALPDNQAWLRRVAGRMNAEAWLRPRRRAIDLGDRAYVLAVEDDPIEVLRMGIPFDTCLSLRGGFNADSTVVNALDANKRVLYLRDARGTIVARKLVALTEDLGMLGYHLYVALGGERAPGLAAAFAAMCRELAEESGITQVDDGVPERIHAGFWYDDGATAWREGEGEGDAAFRALCERLGRPLAPADARARDEARERLAVERGDVAAAQRELGTGAQYDVSCGFSLAAWVAGAVPERELVRRAHRDVRFIEPALRALRRRGPEAMLSLAARLTRSRYHAARTVDALLAEVPQTGAVARAVAAAAYRQLREGVTVDNDGLQHASMSLVDGVRELSVAEGLRLCDALGPAWDRVVDEHPGCEHCRGGGERSLARALLVAYAREPDPEAVLAALGDRRRERLTAVTALHLAARVPLAPHLSARVGGPALARVAQPFAPCRPAVAALQALRRGRPELADHEDMFAALVRHAEPGARPPLPRPAAAPFEALGEALLHVPDAVEIMAPWTGPKDPGGEDLSTWELWFHRRSSTPRLRHLQQLQARGGAPGRAAGERLAAIARPPEAAGLPDLLAAWLRPGDEGSRLAAVQGLIAWGASHADVEGLLDLALAGGHDPSIRAGATCLLQLGSSLLPLELLARLAAAAPLAREIGAHVGPRLLTRHGSGLFRLRACAAREGVDPELLGAAALRHLRRDGETFSSLADADLPDACRLSAAEGGASEWQEIYTSLSSPVARAWLLDALVAETRPDLADELRELCERVEADTHMPAYAKVWLADALSRRAPAPVR